jgi:hypothetical protein
MICDLIYCFLKCTFGVSSIGAESEIFGNVSSDFDRFGSGAAGAEFDKLGVDRKKEDDKPVFLGCSALLARDHVPL